MNEGDIKKQEHKQKTKIFWVILTILGIIFISRLGSNSNNNNSFNPSTQATSASNTDNENPLEVINWKWGQNEYGSAEIIGTVKNNSGKEISYAQVEFNLYDKQGAQVGSAMDNIDNIEPYGTWKFKALVTDDSNVRSAKLVRVEGN